MLDPDRLLFHLRRHIGRKNGITARALVAEIQGQPDLFSRDQAEVTERDLRHAVQLLREKGHHVCAHPSNGYYLAESAEELDATCEFLYERAMASLKQIAAMKRVSAPDLRGQLKLPT